MEKQTLLEIRNRHGKGCGKPPSFPTTDPKIYLGYYENEHGEQWVFTYNRETQEALLTGGDVGWETYKIEGNTVGVILNAGERSWLQSCLEAATAFSNVALSDVAATLTKKLE